MTPRQAKLVTLGIVLILVFVFALGIFGFWAMAQGDAISPTPSN